MKTAFYIGFSSRLTSRALSHRPTRFPGTHLVQVVQKGLMDLLIRLQVTGRRGFVAQQHPRPVGGWMGPESGRGELGMITVKKIYGDNDEHSMKIYMEMI